MEKFSAYDFLGLLLPGAIFVYYCDVMNVLFGILPFSLGADSLDIKTVMLLCLAMVAGAMLFSINFYLNNQPWYKRLFGMKKHVADIYLKLNVPTEAMNIVFNEKAKEWFKKTIFLSRHELSQKSVKKLTWDEKNLQDDFYTRAYYELEYCDKIESAKTLQSFYYFFRQTVAACLILFIIFLVLSLIWMVKDVSIFCNKTCYFILIPLSLVVIIILSAGHAQWYRKSMVLKIYWAYFIHLNQPKEK